MTPPDFIAACVARAVEHACIVVGVRPVTDTVKVVADGVVGETLDRDRLVAVAAPVVLPAAVVADLAGLPATDFVTLVAGLRRRYGGSALFHGQALLGLVTVRDGRAYIDGQPIGDQERALLAAGCRAAGR